MKIWALILLIANLVLAGVIVAVETRPPTVLPSTDLNVDKLKLVPLPPEPASPSTQRPPS